MNLNDAIPEKDTLFGYPITWVEKMPKMPVGDIVLVDLSDWVDWQLCFKERVEEYERDPDTT